MSPCQSCQNGYRMLEKQYREAAVLVITISAFADACCVSLSSTFQVMYKHHVCVNL